MLFPSTTFKKDTIIEVESYKIADYKTTSHPYEGHYPHSKTKLTVTTQKLTFSKGYLYIPTNQQGLRYLLETLEPKASDSLFNWNFFDPILQQKEHFSDYVFEDLATKLLKEDPFSKN